MFRPNKGHKSFYTRRGGFPGLEINTVESSMTKHFTQINALKGLASAETRRTSLAARASTSFNAPKGLASAETVGVVQSDGSFGLFQCPEGLGLS